MLIVAQKYDSIYPLLHSFNYPVCKAYETRPPSRLAQVPSSHSLKNPPRISFNPAFRHFTLYQLAPPREPLVFKIRSSGTLREMRFTGKWLINSESMPFTAQCYGTCNQSGGRRLAIFLYAKSSHPFCRMTPPGQPSRWESIAENCKGETGALQQVRKTLFWVFFFEQLTKPNHKFQIRIQVDRSSF